MFQQWEGVTGRKTINHIQSCIIANESFQSQTACNGEHFRRKRSNTLVLSDLLSNSNQVFPGTIQGTIHSSSFFYNGIKFILGLEWSLHHSGVRCKEHYRGYASSGLGQIWGLLGGGENSMALFWNYCIIQDSLSSRTNEPWDLHQSRNQLSGAGHLDIWRCTQSRWLIFYFSFIFSLNISCKNLLSFHRTKHPCAFEL